MKKRIGTLDESEAKSLLLLIYANLQLFKAEDEGCVERLLDMYHSIPVSRE